MAKRNTDTEIWNEDWFLEMKGRNQHFYNYIKDKCDHAGFWRPNFKNFEQSTGFRINVKEFLDMVNSDYSTGEKTFKERIRVLENGRWWLVGYIPFHFPILNLNNRFHRSVFDTFRKNVNYDESESYGFEVKDTSKGPQGEVKKEEERKKKTEGSKQNIVIVTEYRECSELLKKRILETKQKKITELHLRSWDDTVRLMIQRDGRKINDIKILINECHDMDPKPNGFTWRNNILSMDKLRKQWNEGKIFIGMNNNKPQNQYGRQEYTRDDFKRQMEKLADYE